MLIRPYRQEDEDRVVAVWERSGLTRPWNHPRRDIARKLAADPDLFLVGEVNGCIVAVVMAGYEGHRGWINYLAVDPVHQGRGHGREIMAEAERRLLARGCPKINLQIRADNEQAIGFYEAMGYRRDPVLSMGKRLIVD